MTQEFKDHIVQYPNRFKRVPVAGKTDEFDMIPTWQENPSEVVQVGTPIDAELMNGISAQLAENTQQLGMDFVKLIREHNETPNNIFVKIMKDRSLEIAIPYKGDMCGYYLMEKDTNDDYVKLKEGSIQSVKFTDNIYMKKDPETVSFTPAGSTPNRYTKTIGHQMSFTFEGSGFAWHHFADTRGGIWEFDIDSGAHVVQISTWRATGGDYTTDVIKGLTDGIHSVVATFKGQDPQNPSTDTPAGTARGWFKLSGVGFTLIKTLSIYKTTLNGVKQFNVLNLNSNKEFAVNVYPSYPSSWLPEHNGIGSVFSISQEFWIDNSLVTDWTADIEMKQAKSVRVLQNMYGYWAGDLTNPICEITTIHTFKADGVSVYGKVDFLEETFVSAGYVMMLPVYPSFGEKLVTNNGYSYATTKTDGSSTDVLGKPTSFAFLNETSTDDRKNVVMAMTVDNPHETLREGEDGRRSPLFWISHRTDNIQKLYPQIFVDKTFLTGESFVFGGTFHMGEIPLARKLLV